MDSLFEVCFHVVLGSSYLLDRASLHLPLAIAHFLLYVALKTRNQLAVKKLVEKWPHVDLAVEFTSNALCRRECMVSESCLEPHEYANMFSSAGHSCHENVSSLLEGVFCNVLHYRKHLEMEVVSEGLSIVDISTVPLEGRHVSLLHSLVNGRVPVTHISDYITPNDALKLGVVRPELDSTCTHSSHPLIMYIGVVLGESTSKADIRTLVEACSQRHLMHVIITSLSLVGLQPQLLDSALLHSLKKHCTLKHVYVTEHGSETVGQVLGLGSMSSLPSLWVSCQTQITPLQSTIPLLNQIPNIGALLLASSQRASRLGAKLSKLASQSLNIQAFCLLRPDVTQHRDLRQGLAAFLHSVSEKLLYLQLRRWSLTCIDLDSLLQCSHLRVLCITEESGDNVPHIPIHSVSNVFVALSQLTSLEFFHWSENINMTTAGILSLHDTLCFSLDHIRHFHMSLPFLLLSTTDLENEAFNSLNTILKPLLTGKVGDDSCTMYRYPLDNGILYEWLCALRPWVCFRLGRHVECVTDLHRTATLGNYVY